MFFSENSEIFKNTFFTEQFWMTASNCLILISWRYIFKFDQKNKFFILATKNRLTKSRHSVRKIDVFNPLMPGGNKKVTHT